MLDPPSTDADFHPLYIWECSFPFAFASWLVVTLCMAIDVLNEPDGHVPFTVINSIIFCAMILAPVVACSTAFLVYVWWELRIVFDQDCYRPMSRRISLIMGFLAPVITYLFLELFMSNSSLFGDALNWLILISGLIIYFTISEIIIQLSPKVLK